MSGFKCINKGNSVLFHQMSVMTTLMAVCMGEPAMTASTITHATATCTTVTIVRSYQTSVGRLPISVTMVFATMTTTSPLLFVFATSPIIRVSASLLTPPIPPKHFFCSSGHTSSSERENFANCGKTYAILHTRT